jgi:hypothetical protein
VEARSSARGPARGETGSRVGDPGLKRAGENGCSSNPLIRPLTSDVRRFVLVLTLAAAMGSAVDSALASAPPPGRFGVGDSIMVSATDELDAFGWRVNAEVGRQFSAGLRVVRWRANKGTLPKRVIVHLGTNGAIDPDDCDVLAAAAGPRRRVFLVTVKVPRGWERANNDVLQACAAAHEKVNPIRWYAHSHRHGEWFAEDGYHLNATGQEEYASFLQAKVNAIVANPGSQPAR